MVLSSALTGIVLALLASGALALAWAVYSIRALRDDTRKLLAAFQKTHGYSDPSGAAVVTEGAPVDHGDSAAAPAPVLIARQALAGVARTLESAALPEGPLDTTGDRGGLNPPPPAAPRRLGPPGDRTMEARIQRRFYDRIARSAQAGVNCAHCGGSECSGGDSGVCSCPCDPCSRRPAADAAPGSGPVDRVDARYAQLRAAARATGEACDHCCGAGCDWNDASRPMDLCLCNCAGCTGAVLLFRLADREAHGVAPGQTDGPVHAWIRVDVAPGADASERAVSLSVGEQTYAMLVDAGDVEGDLLRVEVIGRAAGEDEVWIHLPRDPVAGGRHLALPTVRVILRDDPRSDSDPPPAA
jgi:hypothetical protein